MEAWLQQDPVPAFRERLLSDGRFNEKRIAGIEADVGAELEQAKTFAQSSQDPPEALALEHVYA